MIGLEGSYNSNDKAVQKSRLDEAVRLEAWLNIRERIKLAKDLVVEVKHAHENLVHMWDHSEFDPALSDMEVEEEGILWKRRVSELEGVLDILTDLEETPSFFNVGTNK